MPLGVKSTRYRLKTHIADFEADCRKVAGVGYPENPGKLAIACALATRLGRVDGRAVTFCHSRAGG